MDRDRLTQADLAERCGVKQPTVSRWLKGTIPDPQSQTILRDLLEANNGQQEAIGQVNEPANLSRLLALVHESYLYLGLDGDEADELLQLVREAYLKPVEKQSDAGVEGYQRLLAQSVMKKFLRLKRKQTD